MKAYRCTIISAAAYSIVIGIIFVVLGVLSLMARSCIFNMTSSPLTYMIYLMYFRLSSCENSINWSNLEIVADPSVNTILPDESEAALRTFIFTLVYLGLHGALIFTAIFALFGIRGSCMGRMTFGIYFVPWILVSVAVLVMDILATTYYIIDNINMDTTEGLMNLLEVGNPNTVGPILNQISSDLLYLPSVVMFLTTAKGFVFMLFNIFVISAISRAGWTAASFHKFVDKSLRKHNNSMAKTNQAFEDAQTDIIAQRQHDRQMGYLNDRSSIHELHPAAVVSRSNQQSPVPDRYNDTSIQAFVAQQRKPKNNSYNSRGAQDETSQKTVTPRHSDNGNAKLNSNVNLNGNGNANENERMDREIEYRLSSYTASNGSDIRSVEPLKDDMQPEQQKRVKVLPSAPPPSTRSKSDARPQVPPKPHNQKRYSIDEERFERPENKSSLTRVDRSSSINANEEIRGSIAPWSYFKSRDDTPKRVIKDIQEDEDLPPVPVPDYTLHFPKTKRANLNDNSDGDGTWNGHEQRY